MLDPLPIFPLEKEGLEKTDSPIEVSHSLINFCQKMGQVFEIKDFLFQLKNQIPKKLKTGELFLFYPSEQLGLRRAYIRNSIFYEEEAKRPWEQVQSIRPGSGRESLYLAEEFGRPFSKNLMIPLSPFDERAGALLFVETSQEGQGLQDLILFFNERKRILDLIFKRAFLNTRWTRIPYLWSQFFSHWWEPLAILQNFQLARSNESFKKNFPKLPDIPKPKKKTLLETRNKVYQVHYYPISKSKSQDPIGILYCQDMTRQYHLKEQLLQSEKMSSLCELGKNMAHQLNNPLTGVKSMAQILAQNQELEGFKEELIEVEKAAKRSQKIIENLLSFSQLQNKQENCDLNQVVEDTMPLLKSMTQGLTLEMELYSQPLKVRGNLAVLQQVAYNLILNACQALKETDKKHKPVLHIQTEKNSKGEACLKIKDNGPGIPAHHMEKIFQPLWTNKKKGQGTGLGLGIARRFVKKMQGDIHVSSKEGEGTCFSVSLPLNSPPS